MSVTEGKSGTKDFLGAGTSSPQAGNETSPRTVGPGAGASGIVTRRLLLQLLQAFLDGAVKNAARVAHRAEADDPVAVHNVDRRPGLDFPGRRQRALRAAAVPDLGPGDLL